MLQIALERLDKLDTGPAPAASALAFEFIRGITATVIAACGVVLELAVAVELCPPPSRPRMPDEATELARPLPALLLLLLVGVAVAARCAAEENAGLVLSREE